MEQLYLEQLVVKPMPKKQEKIIVKVKIVDKTKEMHINRQMILNRLNNKNLLQVRKQVPNQIITIKKPKKINEIPTSENTKLKTNTYKASEIYIHDLLIIDYRKYRKI
jgi:acetolactate synthase small subunit